MKIEMVKDHGSIAKGTVVKDMCPVNAARLLAYGVAKEVGPPQDLTETILKSMSISQLRAVAKHRKRACKAKADRAGLTAALKTKGAKK